MVISSQPKPQVMVLYPPSGTYIKYVQPLESNYWPHITLNTHYTHAHLPFCYCRMLTHLGRLQVCNDITMAQAPGYGVVSSSCDQYKVCSTTGKQLMTSHNRVQLFTNPASHVQCLEWLLVLNSSNLCSKKAYMV